MDYRFNTESFKDWMEGVESWLIYHYGLSSSDLPDVCYVDMYDAGISSRIAADTAIQQVVA